MNILISGGSGLVGTELSKMLRAKGHSISILSRKKSNAQGFVQWNVEQGTIDKNALKGIDAIIHLAGEGIADERWTDERKVSIIDSRVNSTRLLLTELQKGNHQVKTFISASATGYYSERGEDIMFEDASAARDFLGTTCVLWEQEVNKIAKLGIRTVKLRTGIVLTLDGGALKKMIVPFKFGVGSALGDGKQWMSWIHVKDLCEMYIYSLENEQLNGEYNAVTPKPVTNYEFSKTLAEVMNKPFWAPNVPAFILKFIFGEMSAVVLGSTKASSTKIEKAGFKFEFDNLKVALKNLLKK
jgi:uncharacterized protein